jgi:hypothetical protein
MTKGFLYLLILAFAGIIVTISCKKETSCEGSKEKNKPPIAIAGSDQVITLPTDSVSLDGRTSNDPDGKISEWLWTKISGPASVNIIRQSDSISNVKALVTGTYEFELKVTDNGGLSAKDTIRVIVDPVLTTNHPPIANAGNDTTIILPANSINLDGSRSTGPANNIVSYTWSKISGPSSFFIANANTVQTQVINLAAGIYQFELKVVDAGGLFSKDSVQINVTNASPPTSSCNIANRPLISGQLILTGTLSQIRAAIAVASAGTKIVFAGGYINGNGSSTRVDIFDFVTNTWTTAELSQARYGISSNVIGNKIFFAGGYKDANRTSSRVDIYDVVANTWSTTELSQDRAEIAAGAAGDKVLFAGGVHAEDGYWGSELTVFSDRVDIYDASSNTWSVAALSARMRVGMAATTVGSKIYFAGGTGYWSAYDYGTTSQIDIYDAGTNLWSTSSLISGRGGLTGVAVNNKIYWAGGEIYQVLPENIAEVEIRDVSTLNTSLDCLFQPNSYFSAVVKNNKIVFFTGTGTQKNKFDIYDTSTNSWSIGVLPNNVSGSIISVNNIIYIAGAVIDGNLSNGVWKLEF